MKEKKKKEKKKEKTYINFKIDELLRNDSPFVQSINLLMEEIFTARKFCRICFHILFTE